MRATILPYAVILTKAHRPGQGQNYQLFGGSMVSVKS